MEDRVGIVIGLGNPLLGDDGIGYRAVAAMPDADLPAAFGRVVTSAFGINLLDHLVGARWVVLVDAVADDAAPWRVTVREAPTGAGMPRLTPHFWGLPQVLEFARRAGLAVPEQVMLVLVHVPAARLYVVREGLSPEAERLIPVVQERVRAVARDLADGRYSPRK